MNGGFYATANVTLEIVDATSATNQESITYYDGLGKPKQQIAIGQSPNGKDIVQHIAYDEFGRVSEQYLPLEYTGGTLGFYRSDAAMATKTYYKTNYPEDFQGVTNTELITAYAKNEYELSPLNRITKQSAPGELLKMGSDHELKLDYKINVAEEVKYYTVNSDGSLGGGTAYYAVNTLQKSIVKNQNWQPSDGTNYTTETFTNKLGKTILKRAYNSNEAYDTYYVYDNRQNLRYVLPPKLQEREPCTTNYNKYFAQNLFTGTTYGTGGVRVEFDGDEIKVTFNASFRQHVLNANAITLNTSCPLPDMFLGNPTVQPYGTLSVSISGGKLVISNGYNMNISGITGTLTKTLTEEDFTPTQEALNHLAYQYKYDNWNRLIEKKLPGKSWEYIVYDAHDRAILTQDGTLRAQNLWAFTKYDTYGRNIYTGTYLPAERWRSRSRVQQLVDIHNNGSNKNNSEERTTGTTTVGGVALNYSNTAFPNTGIEEVLAVNYYDDYAFSDADKPTIPTSVLEQIVTTRTNGLATASWLKTLGENTWSKSYTFYDEKAREIRVYAKNHLGGSTIVDSEIQFNGTVAKTVATHKKTTSDTPIAITGLAIKNWTIR